MEREKLSSDQAANKNYKSHISLKFKASNCFHQKLFYLVNLHPRHAKTSNLESEESDPFEEDLTDGRQHLGVMEYGRLWSSMISIYLGINSMYYIYISLYIIACIPII